MSSGLVISDSGPIFSLAIVDCLYILDTLFNEIVIPKAVWNEISKDKSFSYYPIIEKYFKSKVKEISTSNNLIFIMDYGESEALILYEELTADFLLIDDKKARAIAESFGANCIGTIGVLSIAKSQGIIEELKPIFEMFLNQRRFYSKKLLNSILKKHNEQEIDIL